MSNESRRRVAMAVGAILAGAAIPLAGAGSAWADDETREAIAAESEAKADVKQGIPVDLSVNGKTIIDTCSSCTAQSGRYDVALAVGANSYATDKIGDTHDLAVATNGGVAKISDATASVASGTDGGLAGINQVFTPSGSDRNDISIAEGSGSVSLTENATSSTATAIDTAGGNGAAIFYATGSTATAFGADSGAGVTGSKGAEITASTAIADNGGLALVNSNGSAPAGITVTQDFAYASGTGSTSGVLDSEATSLATNDGSYNVLKDVSNVIEVNPDQQSGGTSNSIADVTANLHALALP